MEPNVTRYKAVTNEDIAEAIMELISPMLMASGSDEKIVEAFMEIAVKAWNIALFPPEEGDQNYDKKIETILPRNMESERAAMIKNFVRFIITEKRKRYPDHLKGIKSHKHHIREGKSILVVEALPIKPLNLK